jgi:hypothetical protein
MQSSRTETRIATILARFLPFSYVQVFKTEETRVFTLPLPKGHRQEKGMDPQSKEDEVKHGESL